MFQQTAVVATEEELGSSPSTDELRELRKQNRSALIAELMKRDFKPDTKNKSHFYNESMPGVRFVLTRNYARFERLQEGDTKWVEERGEHLGTREWKLSESYSLTDETDLALKVINRKTKH